MEILNPFFNFKSTSYSLNSSGTRKVQAHVISIYPAVKVVIRLTAVDHRRHVDFSTTTWNAIVTRSSEIKEIMKQEREEEIFRNEEILVFTEERHEQCAICFVNPEGSRVNMMIKTFKNMMKESSNIVSAYEKLYENINETAIKFKLFIDTLFIQHNHCDVNNEQFNRFLIDLQQLINSLCQVSDNSIQNYEYTTSDYDEEFL